MPAPNPAPNPALIPPPATLVIFGITGDLSRRYLLPALYHLSAAELLPGSFTVIGVTRRAAAPDDIIQTLRGQLAAKGEQPDDAALGRLRAALVIRTMDLTSLDAYHGLRGQLDDLETRAGACHNRLYYLSIPPGAYGPVVDLLGEAGLAGSCRHGRAESRLMVEKPFGFNYATAAELIARLTAAFTENQIYRIDHYLAKETAQNLLTFRAANPIFAAIWNRHTTSRITVTSSEEIGIEGRAAFYEPVGALRDVVQNHLLQLLSLVAMEPPAAPTAEAIHAAKLRLLEDIAPIPPDAVAKLTVRGQYTGYRDEAANPHSIAETFARLHLSINNDRWRGVPVVVQNGKALDRKTTEITFEFSDPRLPEAGSNQLTFRLQPDEGIVIDLLAKRPGFADQTERVEMSFKYQDSFAGQVRPDAYERVLLDGLRGDQTLFASSAEILASWRIIDGVVAEWAKSGEGLAEYAPGTPPADIHP